MTIIRIIEYLSNTIFYKFEQILGKGGFGTVFSGVNKIDGSEVAIKQVLKGKISSIQDNIPIEVFVLKQISDVPGVIKLLDYYELDDSFHIVMEKFNGQDLFDFISHNGPIKEQIAKHIFSQVVETIYMCYEKGIIHGDIKDENIMININDLSVKLIDFGSARHIKFNIDNTYEGTTMFTPPEWISLSNLNGESLTVWSLGILLYDMLFGDIPFKTVTEIFVKDILFFEKIELSESVFSLLNDCLKKNYKERISLYNVKNHKWLSDKVYCR